jgi:hypothetical protein
MELTYCNIRVTEDVKSKGIDMGEITLNLFIKGLGREISDWIQLSQGMFQWPVLLETGMNFWVA